MGISWSNEEQGVSTPLTDTHIRNLKYVGKPKKYFDGGGLFLFVTANGSKLWRMAYRFEHKEKLLSFGEYPTSALPRYNSGWLKLKKSSCYMPPLKSGSRKRRPLCTGLWVNSHTSTACQNLSGIFNRREKDTGKAALYDKAFVNSRLPSGPHSVCDGYHVGKLAEALRNMTANCNEESAAYFPDSASSRFLVLPVGFALSGSSGQGCLG